MDYPNDAIDAIDANDAIEKEKREKRNQQNNIQIRRKKRKDIFKKMK